MRRAAMVLALAALIAIGFAAVHKQLRDGNDFPIYWHAARELLAGRSPYEVGTGLHGYVYLPWFALCMAPLALLPLPAAATCWYVLNVVFTAFAGFVLWRALREAGLAPRPATLAFATLPLAGLFHDNLVLGQANLFLLWVVALGIRAAQRSGDRAHRGLAFGVAGALKMPAAVLALPMLARGRILYTVGVGFGILIAAGLPMVEGGSAGVRLLEDWREKVLAPAAAGTLQGSKIIDQSPQAALRRLLVAEPAFDDHAVNVASLDSDTFARVSRSVSIAVLLAYAAFWLCAPARGAPLALLIDLALGCCAMVQMTGFNLKAQFVVLLLPAWLAVTLAGPRARVPLAIAGALFLLSQPGLVGRTASNWLLAGSSMTLGTLLLTLTLAVQRLTLPPSAARTAAPAPGTAP